jgi:hypothetical protein
MVTRRLKLGERRVQVNITLHPDVEAAIDDYAWKLRKTKSRLINDICAEWLAAQDGSETVALKVSSAA